MKDDFVRKRDEYIAGRYENALRVARQALKELGEEVAEVLDHFSHLEAVSNAHLHDEQDLATAICSFCGRSRKREDIRAVQALRAPGRGQGPSGDR